MAKFILDPGHGGNDPGATYKERKESNDVLKLTLRVGALLKENGQTVLYTRETDKALSLTERSNYELKNGCDYFISIHRNAVGAEVAKGVETYIYNGSYSSKETCRSLAAKVNSNLVGVGFVDRKVKEANFHVLRETKNPAILIEVGFIDNTSDNNLFDSKLEKIAQAIARGCLKQIGKELVVNNSSSNSKSTYFRVVCGSYKDRNNAVVQQNKLKAAGFETFLEAFRK